MNYPRILGIGTATTPIRLTQEQSFHAAGYETERIRKIFANSDIEYRHFYFGGTPNLQENSDQQNQRYLSGAIKIGCRAILNCVEIRSGEEVIVVGGGNSAGQAAVFLAGATKATAAKDCRVDFIPRARLLNLFRHDPQVGYQIVRILSEEISDMRQVKSGLALL